LLFAARHHEECNCSAKNGEFVPSLQVRAISPRSDPARTISYNAPAKSPKYRFDRIASEAFWTRDEAGAE